MQSSDVKRGSEVIQSTEVQNIDSINNRVVEIKEQLNKGEYKLMPPHILAKVLIENELTV